MSTDKHTGPNVDHYTINMETHYTIEFKYEECSWIHRWGWNKGEVKCFSNLEAATREMEEVFNNQGVDEATIIEWKKTPVLVKRNIKPVIESKTSFNVEVYDREHSKWGWRDIKYGLETLKEAQDYIVKQQTRDILHPNYRIVQRDVTVKTSIV